MSCFREGANHPAMGISTKAPPTMCRLLSGLSHHSMGHGEGEVLLGSRSCDLPSAPMDPQHPWTLSTHGPSALMTLSTNGPSAPMELRQASLPACSVIPVEPGDSAHVSSSWGLP